jgi:hypothetical protein
LSLKSGEGYAGPDRHLKTVLARLRSEPEEPRMGEHRAVRILDMQLTATMTVLRLSDGNLLLYSPPALTASAAPPSSARIRVEHLHAPNTASGYSNSTNSL